MNRAKLTIVAVLLPLLTFAQTVVEESTSVLPLEQKEDTTVVSIADIIKEKEESTSRSNLINHFNKVWSRRGFFNIAYNFSTLSPKEDVVNGDGKNLVQKYKSNVGVSLQVGRSYRLHKKPIANFLQFYIDYTAADLSFNHYQMEANGKNLYNSSVKWSIADKRGNLSDYNYIPWDMEKYEGSFGMSIGPSFTVLPFSFIRNKNGLHFIKFNMYFRVGYQASILYMVNDDDADINRDISSKEFELMSDNLKMTWGHGLMTNFGLSLTWKGIGIGYEHRVAHNKFKPVSTSDFGSESYKFKTSTDRIYISIRMGR